MILSEEIGVSIMSVGKFLSPKNDFAFKRIFGTEKNQDILVDFINAILRFEGAERIETVIFLTPIQDPEIAAKKQSIVDILCTDQKGQQYIIEMQVAHMAGFEKRAQYYASKAYSRQLMVGKGYHNLKAVIFVAITDFVMFPDKAAYKSDHVILDKETYSHDLKDFSFTFLELPKFKKTNINDLTDIVERWTYFFKYAEATNEDDILKIAGNDEAILKAYTALNRFNWTDTELLCYEEEEKREIDARVILSTAEAKGKAEGLVEGESKILLRLLLRKFGVVPEKYKELLLSANDEKLLNWGDRILDANSIEEVFE